MIFPFPVIEFLSPFRCFERVECFGLRSPDYLSLEPTMNWAFPGAIKDSQKLSKGLAVFFPVRSDLELAFFRLFFFLIVFFSQKGTRFPFVFNIDEIFSSQVKETNFCFEPLPSLTVVLFPLFSRNCADLFRLPVCFSFWIPVAMPFVLEMPI